MTFRGLASVFRVRRGQVSMNRPPDGREPLKTEGLAFCLSEDRPDSETGLRLAVLSLSKHCPGAPIYVYRPKLASAFATWAKRYPEARVIHDRPAGAHTWNCKPQALKP